MSSDGQHPPRKLKKQPDLPIHVDNTESGLYYGPEEWTCPDYASTGRCSRLSPCGGKHAGVAPMVPRPQGAAKGGSTQKDQQSVRNEAETVVPRARDDGLISAIRVSNFSATHLATARREKRPVSEGNQQTMPRPNGIELDENLSDGRGEIVSSSKASPGNTSPRTKAINNHSSPKEGNLRASVRLSRSQQKNALKDIYEVPDDEEIQIEEEMSDEALNIILGDSTVALDTNPILGLDATASMTLRSRHGRRRSCTILPSTESGLLPHPGKEAFSKFMLELKPSVITPERLWHCPITGCERHKDSLLYEYKAWKKKQALKQHLEAHHYEKLASAAPGSASTVPSHDDSPSNEEKAPTQPPKPTSSGSGSASGSRLPDHSIADVLETEHLLSSLSGLSVPALSPEEHKIANNLSQDSGDEQRLADLQAQLEAYEVGNSDILIEIQ